MRTLLSRFSQDFVRSLRPLIAPLDQALQGLAQAPHDLPGRGAVPELRELRHQLGVLVEKVEDQHAFVLIFGPLKSGKSTLMNALSAAYVSEVSSLPAYPCMVYVSHADERSYTLTRYDGRTETLSDTAALQMTVQRAHGELVAALRRSEERGEEFDPALHFPQAIRRIDVRLPAGDLAESGAVLVDTPGLYSRMKFGYDRMTRDFRNAAACAIFVVKTDNLFLEQVFAEFNDLLDLFSRIFLVVNVDTTKMDLGPRGDLVPSLEQEDPLRIVEAFENFSMSAPLKRAADEGKLKIYPIDLLRGASRRLKELGGAPAESDGPGEDYRGQTNFASFQADLTDFLNSTDYLVAFVTDSLRRAEGLSGELDQLLHGEPVQELRSRMSALEDERRDLQRRRGGVARLDEFAWESSFEELRAGLSSLVREQGRRSSDRTAAALDGSLGAWFETDASFQSLTDDDLEPLCDSHQEELVRFVHEKLEREAASLATGNLAGSDLRPDLALADVRLGEIARGVLEQVRAQPPAVDTGPLLTTVDVPVKKKLFWDWILFRSRAAIRRRILGPPHRPANRIPRSVKESRLGDEAREAMRDAIDVSETEFFDACTESVETSLVQSFTQSLAGAVRETIALRRKELEERLAKLEARLKLYAGVLERLDRLETRNAEAREALEGLRVEFGEEGFEIVPAPRLEPVEEPAAEPLVPEPTPESAPASE